jgi:protein-disulfide isomerase
MTTQLEVHITRHTGQPLSRRERRAQARLDPRPVRGRRSKSAGRPAWQSPVAIVSAAALVIGLVVVLVALPKPTSNDGELHSPPVPYPTELIDADTIGKADAPVVIELYSDFQCPACKQLVTEQLHRLVADFVVPGTVRIVARDIAFLGTGQPDESVELAAGAACATEQDRYWQFHDFVFWNQGRENRGDHDAAFIARLADAAELDRTAWDACFARADVRAPIRAQTASAQGKGVTSTPTLIVNGQPVVGVRNYDQLAAMINQLATAASPAPGSTATPTTGATGQ